MTDDDLADAIVHELTTLRAIVRTVLRAPLVDDRNIIATRPGFWTLTADEAAVIRRCEEKPCASD